MTSAARRFRPEDYTVAWICALPLEMIAAAAMLDETHKDLKARPNDDNTYILGRICDHNVAIACLPSGIYGTTSATRVATQMQSTFKSIRFCLMVGIGGGAPSGKVDIRLGDVVVSKPTRDFGGVIQYDYGKTVTDGRFERTGLLNKPPTVLLTAISRLQSEHALKPSKIPSLLSEAVARNHRMRKKFTYCGEDQDLLFDFEYDHPDPEIDCDSCDTRRVVTRPHRASNDPVIHYGLIASGNQVLKHGRTRDKLTRDLGILCFEMEAAGLMDNFPCLVIRGICDYSDSHKNKQWQDYAAATAAAYGKELLSLVHREQTADTPPLGTMNELYSYREQPLPRATLLNREVVKYDGQEFDELLERISSYDYERVHQRLSRKRLAGTTDWFLHHPDFQAWFTKEDFSSLWCSGKIGWGKTMIATAIIDAAKYDLRHPTVFFYCEKDHHAALDALSILSSFIKQLCSFLHQATKPFPEDVSKEITKYFGRKRVKPDLEDLKDIFTILFPCAPGTIYVVDGVDTLDREQAISLLSLFRSLFLESRRPNGSRILLFSRDQVPGYINIDTFMPGICRISTSANVMQDIETYIEASITDKTMHRKITDDPMLAAEIPRRLLIESSEMFLWVYLQLEILWDTCHTDEAIRSALASLPKGLEDTYGRCIERIDIKDRRVLKVLKWVSFANIPLHVEELREAVAFDSEDTAWNAEKIPGKEFVIGCCANLVVVDSTDNRVRFAHPSVKQYLEKSRSKIFIQGYPSTAQGALECGEFCVAYLSFSDFSLQLSTRRNETAMVTVPPPILFAPRALPRLFTKRFFQKPPDQKHYASVPIRGIRTSSTPDRKQYKFLDYAVANWALQTKQIPRSSAFWKKFEQLVMSFNETWNFHPWVPGGRSTRSHLHSLLGWAVKERHLPLLSIVQAAGPDLQTVCNLPLVGESLPALHIAAKLGYKAIVEILLAFCNVNAQDLEQYTALHHAASAGHLEICQILLSEKKIKMNNRPEFQYTAISLAARNGHEKVVSLLVEKQGEFETKDSSSPILLAAGNGHEAVVKILLEKGADIEAKRESGWTPLIFAAANGHEAVVKILLEKGADIEAKSESGWTPLIFAAANEHEAVVKILLEKGADLEAKNESNRTPLFFAARNGNEAVVRILLEKGADLEAKNESNRTPLFFAARNGHEAVVRILLEKGADLEAKSESGWTPLSSAAENGHEAVVEILLEKGADLEAKDKSNRTPLSLAAENGHEAVVEILLEKGAHIEAKDLFNRTPLLLAAENGHEEVVKILLEKGAHIEAKDLFNRTPLSLAAEKGHEAVVRILLEKGADLVAKSDSGWTPLLYASMTKQEAVMKMLLDKGGAGTVEMEY
ncbi:hypothetical protein N7466_007440 [Penicillium verhagenii]|uniref:uncharacterized protein n=1 Tax=Penicillium verhagenii TaxID=1562060 RepID=UPI00254526F9|nr:uncharacterized protein N7466_007440 [Penicillium verhagenii]KAJ5928484.1 hypothetical protein N7466_007440 [Penicillium verhagenii]